MLKSFTGPVVDSFTKIKRLKETNHHQEANRLITLGWEVLNIRIAPRPASGLKEGQEEHIFTLGHQSLSPPVEPQLAEIQTQE